jgi:transposase-like protein
MANNLDKLMFHDDDKAREWLEARVWPNGPVCPHCGAVRGLTRMQGDAHRPGAFQCNQCRGQFTVTVGTVFERSKVPLHTWLHALYLMNASKKGMSAHQIHRMIGVSYKTAWFMCHRIREAMASGSFAGPIGGEGKVVEADETYIGRKEGTDKRRGHGHKRTVVSLVERGGEVRSFHVDSATKETVGAILRKNTDLASRLMTDESRIYSQIGAEYARHESVNHSAYEYVRGEAHTQTIDGYFSIFKRGMKGVYQHCGEQHLHRYLAEFDFRYNNRIKLGVDDMARTEKAAAGIVGKRLTYRRIGRQQAAA